MKLPSGNAICYSGYRPGQDPGARIYPSEAEILEDLLILRKHWQVLRLYDCSLHAQRVLDVIRREKLAFKVMLGAWLGAEVNNAGCPWGVVHSAQALEAQRIENDAETARLVDLARAHEDLIFAVAVGNECTVDWTDHMVPVGRMIELVRRVRHCVTQPVTFCENYVPWADKLRPLVAELDFISLHTYPVWEWKQPQEAIHYSKENYYGIARLYPDKPVVISEAGWTTCSNGRGIHPDNSSEELQQRYYADLMDWVSAEDILTFVFAAFDEPWKGSADPREPEKHWGLFTADRKPKKVVEAVYA